MAENTRPDVDRQAGEGGLSRKDVLLLTVASALAVAVGFQAMMMAYNNYNLWRLEVMALEVPVALAASFGANLLRGVEERSRAWALGYVPEGAGWLFELLRIVPPVLVRAAMMAAFLAVPNATAIPAIVYRESFGNPVIAVLMRFLADLPAAVVLCLVVRLLVERRARRRA